MDRFFDMLNVRSKDESVRKRKDDLKPYELAHDSHLTWLEDIYIPWVLRCLVKYCKEA